MSTTTHPSSLPDLVLQGSNSPHRGVHRRRPAAIVSRFAMSALRADAPPRALFPAFSRCGDGTALRTTRSAETKDRRNRPQHSSGLAPQGAQHDVLRGVAHCTGADGVPPRYRRTSTRCGCSAVSCFAGVAETVSEPFVRIPSANVPAAVFGRRTARM